MPVEGLSVAFDVTAAISGRTGIARYVGELAAELERQSIRVKRFAVGRASSAVPQRTRHLPIPARSLVRWWQRVDWPRAEQLAGGGELVHATGLLLPPTRRPLVVTVHDVAPLLFPELHPPRHVQQSRLQLAALERAAVILAVSGSTAEDLVRLGLRRDRLVVTPLGLCALPAPERPTGLPDRYLLTVGETSPRKRYGLLLHALSRLGPDTSLLMAGPAAADEQRLRSVAESLGVAPRVHRLGAVSDAALAGLYDGALALCFPSVAEGFGLPVLEAMSRGVPVLAADVPAVRELAGDAARYIEGDDPDEWAHAIDEIRHDEGLRNLLGERGRERAAHYTWERTALATLDGYRLALAPTAGPIAG